VAAARRRSGAAVSWLGGPEGRVSILVVGNAVVDIAYRVRRLPRPGETVLAMGRTVDAGGKGLNQAVAARRAGAEVGLVAPVGGDEPARRIRDVLAREGLDPALPVAVDAPTDEAVIWVAEDGENAIVSTAAAAHGLRPADVAAVGDLGPADTLLMQGNLPLGTIARCLEAARGGGARIVVNTAPGVPGAELLVAMADVLVVNAGEAAGLSGAAAPAAAAEALVGHGPGCVVVTLGAAGAHLRSGGTHHRLPAPAVAAVDTTGAGDVLVGVLTAALDAGVDLRAAAAWAIRAASLKVTRHGTIAGFPTAAEVAALRQP
jgi:ribokinase